MAAAPEKLLHGPACVGGGAATSAASSSRPSIRVLDTVLVHPSSSSAPPPEETSLPLTFFDVVWLHFPPVQRVLFYRLAPDAEADAILRDSLSHALRAFYPLAGRLRLAPGTANRYELHYRPGVDGVAFTVAEYDAEFDSLAADEPREVSRLAPLAPPLPAGGAVLALQATLLRRGGLALGVTVHHAACDGAASTHFLHTWAAAATGRSRSPPPVIDRTLIADPRGLYDVLCPATAEETARFVDKMPDDRLILGTFTLSRARLQRAKEAVMAAASAPPPRCTSLVAALGLIWSCYHRAKPLAAGERTCLGFSVDHRSRLSPPLPDKYFGNCVGGAFAIAPRTELAAAGTGGLLAAFAAVAAGIEEAASGGDATETMAASMERFGEIFATMGVLSVAGSPRFRVYDLDMGFGPPAKVEIVSVATTGALAVADSRAGDGGVEVGVCLPPEAMDAFRKCFDDAVAGLDGPRRRAPELFGDSSRLTGEAGKSSINGAQ